MKIETIEAAVAHAVAEYPKESCGVVIIFNGRERYQQITNLANTPGQHFVMDHVEYAEAEERGEITAIVHSHPDAPSYPSECDKVSCEQTQLPWMIVSVGAEGFNDTHLHAPCGYVAPLVGRSYHHGVLDCYALIRDYYSRELGIELPDFERQDDWWNKGDNLYVEHMEAGGFEKIAKPLQVGDLIIMQVRSPVPNHGGVYIGDGQMLHHAHGRMSSRDLYDGYWQENTVMYLRRKPTQ
jgi:cell wall-associated NlpC family hydrolase